MTALSVVFLGLFGLAVGSFGCVVIDRLPLALDEANEVGERWDTRPWREVTGGRSRCSGCGVDVPARLNLPVVSWLALRGRCRECGVRIPAFHPVAEAAVPLAWIGAGLALDWNWWLVAPMLWFVAFGVPIAVIDLRTLIVPTRLVWPGTAVLVVLLGVAAVGTGEAGVAIGAAIGAALLGGLLFAIWWVKPDGMGFGDVRLAVPVGLLAGALVGEGGVLLVVFSVVLVLGLASLLGLVLGVVMWRRGAAPPPRESGGEPSPSAAPEGPDLDAEPGANLDADLEHEPDTEPDTEPEAGAGSADAGPELRKLAVPFGPALLGAAYIVAVASPLLIDQLGLL